MKRTLNIYSQWNFARYAFSTACENLKEGDVVSRRDLTIKGESSITIFACYTNKNDFCQKYLRGWILNEVNNYANLPCDARSYIQSRILQE